MNKSSLQAFWKWVHNTDLSSYLVLHTTQIFRLRHCLSKITIIRILVWNPSYLGHIFWGVLETIFTQIIGFYPILEDISYFFCPLIEVGCMGLFFQFVLATTFFDAFYDTGNSKKKNIKKYEKFRWCTQFSLGDFKIGFF